MVELNKCIDFCPEGLIGNVKRAKNKQIQVKQTRYELDEPSKKGTTEVINQPGARFVLMPR